MVFAFQKFHQYTYGKEAHVESDHKLLEMIVKKPLAEAPPRLQRMLLQLQKYSFDLKFKPGREMVLADTLSRAYIPKDPADSSLEEELECAVHLITENAPISDVRLDEIKQMTKTDTALAKSVYVIVWLAVVFGINSASNPGRKIVIVRGAAERYYNFHACIASTINFKYYSKLYCYRLIQYCCRR